MTQNAKQARPCTGLGQLSLVEHALCPLNARQSLVDNMVFDVCYPYSTKGGKRLSANARIFAPLGLSANDEFYLWGLLALTLLRPESGPELFATPHWCLKQLGVINQSSRRGGRQYTQFAESLQRLSSVSYINDAFYDPVGQEHRRVSFKFFSYSLPLDPKSDRAWRIAWDGIFYRLVQANAGHLRFDLAVYRELDPATRRLFLFVSKVLSQRKQIRAISLENVAVDLLGFSSSLERRKMKAKVTLCLAKLQALEVLSDAEVVKTTKGNYFVRMTRGRYLTQKTPRGTLPTTMESPLIDTLCSIGFEPADASRLVQQYPHRALSEWADITQAARERHGLSFFKRSPMAYLVDNVKHASSGDRTPPDWWQDLQRQERRKQACSPKETHVFSKIRQQVFGPEELNLVPERKTPAEQMDSARHILKQFR